LFHHPPAWETKPGWQHFFLNTGYDVYVSDAVEPPISGLPEIGFESTQVGYSRLGWRATDLGFTRDPL
jgi:hypothetical protein